MREAGNEAKVRREEMGIGMNNALAVMYWRTFRFLHGDFTSRDIVWLLIGVLLAVVTMWVLSHRRRRWF